MSRSLTSRTVAGRSVVAYNFRRPDRVVCGTVSERARQVLRELYRPLFLNETPMLFTSRETSELIKYAANAFLATKITFINEVADLCERVGADVQQVARGIGLDNRIGGKFLHAGPGYGGSCFPKDIRAISHTGREYGVELKIVQAVEQVNEHQKTVLVRKIFKRFGNDLSGRTFGLWGLAFKPNTDDMREATSRVVISELFNRGATVTAYDPVAMEEAKRIFGDEPRLRYAESPMDALKGADALVIVTEWKEFRSPDFDRIKAELKTPVVFDGRNLYEPALVKASGLDYAPIGRAQP